MKSLKQVILETIQESVTNKEFLNENDSKYYSAGSLYNDKVYDAPARGNLVSGITLSKTVIIPHFADSGKRKIISNYNVNLVELWNSYLSKLYDGLSVSGMLGEPYIKLQSEKSDEILLDIETRLKKAGYKYAKRENWWGKNIDSISTLNSILDTYFK